MAFNIFACKYKNLLELYFLPTFFLFHLHISSYWSLNLLAFIMLSKILIILFSKIFSVIIIWKRNMKFWKKKTYLLEMIMIWNRIFKFLKIYKEKFFLKLFHWTLPKIVFKNFNFVVILKKIHNLKTNFEKWN